MSSCDPHYDVGIYTYSTLSTINPFNATVVDVQGGNDFPFKPFFNGNGILIDETTNPNGITISYTGAPGSGYTYSTNPVLGYDATVVNGQVGNDFVFKPLFGSSGVIVDETTNPGAITISATPYTYSTLPVPFDVTVVDTMSGNDFQFKGLTAGNNINLDDTTVPGSIIISSVSPLELYQNNTLFVDAEYGNDGTGTYERRDLPYETIQAAVANAHNGDLIYVFPGQYTGGVSVAFETLNFHFENGASWTGTNVSLLEYTTNSPNIKSVISGFGEFTSVLTNGSIITSMVGEGEITLYAKRINVSSSSTGFIVKHLNLTINCPIINGSSQAKMFNLNSLTLERASLIQVNSNVITNFTQLLFTIMPMALQINTDFLSVSMGNIPMIDSNSLQLNVEINANSFEIRNAGTAPFAKIIEVGQIFTESPTDITIKTNIFNTECSQLVDISSNKIPNFGTKFHVFSNNYAINILTSSSYYINALNADIHITADNVALLGIQQFGNFAKVAGNLFMDVKNAKFGLPTVFEMGVFILANNAFLDIDNFNWCGLMQCDNGYINSSFIEGLKNCSLTGTWFIDAKNFRMSNTEPITLIQCDDLKLNSDNAQFNTGLSNQAIIIDSGSTASISAAELRFTATTPHVDIINSGLLTMDVRYLKNMSAINTANMLMNCEFLKCDTLSSNSVIENRSILNASINRAEVDLRSVIFNSRDTAVSNYAIQNFTHTSSLTSVEVFSVSNSATLNAVVNNVNFAPTATGVFVSTSANNFTSNMKVGRAIVSGASTVFAQMFGLANLNLDVDTVNLNCPLLLMASATSKSVIRSGYTETTSPIALVNIVANPTGRLEFQGVYKTAGPNVMVNNNATNLSLSGVKLISTAACINSTTLTLKLNMIPSTTRFLPSGAGITIVPAGLLFADPLLD